MAFKKAAAIKTAQGYKLTWQGENTKEIKIYAAGDSAFLPADKYFIGNGMGGECEVEVDFDERAYFILESADGSKIRTAERLKKAEKIRNFRDIGGYPTNDGGWVKWGVLYRSGAHDKASQNDLQLLQSLGVKSVIDYRSTREFTESPDRKADGIIYLSNPPFPENAGAADVLHFNIENEQKVDEGLIECNRVLATAEESFKAYHQLFKNALNDERVPFLQHCTAGKDRVGVGVCCMLLTLGVDKETIIEDYLLSNLGKLSRDELKVIFDAQGKVLNEDEAKAADALMGVKTMYLEKFLEIVERDYADFNEFLQKALGITAEEIQIFRDKYTERF